MTQRFVIVFALGLAVLGCSMSDKELKERTGDAAVSIKHATEAAGDKLKGAYDDAAAKGKQAMEDAGAQLSDVALRSKVLAGFSLVSGLEAKDVTVEVQGGVVTLSGSVPTKMDKMKAEGVAFGVTGDAKKVQSTLTVKGS